MYGLDHGFDGWVEERLVHILDLVLYVWEGVHVVCRRMGVLVGLYV